MNRTELNRAMIRTSVRTHPQGGPAVTTSTIAATRVEETTSRAKRTDGVDPDMYQQLSEEL